MHACVHAWVHVCVRVCVCMYINECPAAVRQQTNALHMPAVSSQLPLHHQNKFLEVMSTCQYNAGTSTMNSSQCVWCVNQQQESGMLQARLSGRGWLPDERKKTPPAAAQTVVQQPLCQGAQPAAHTIHKIKAVMLAYRKAVMPACFPATLMYSSGRCVYVCVCMYINESPAAVRQQTNALHMPAISSQLPLHHQNIFWRL